ncbi:MAG: hypothetical protein CLLPBCKN_007214 [Chroococcidiopsis cubana SAG 39.79]|uniref:Uncharacterized protein n=1 Tax=Chroococcidiopsis cubana SAG 39.79 TaxID=388085 RepID=A0AB37URK5_9CYAN|nr:hypothetical protein [Chroococcidiopsis cubana]MDZ4877779.1 hypothetical protein [Chroococcidiopsis cubana SAG 39.79]PSB66613.1 hypothetical protein C7B79_00150 [Chroococcidiopsis cubana CCALA 043]PSB66654.1 hypothetical protein C7B79_00355 [Chroococcidiopsis cubana CCALA 043]RUT14059.1 hypothetical protein DSM107010_05420 [Chroococcidiopsis cubana SAG 39.79]
MPPEQSPLQSSQSEQTDPASGVAQQSSPPAPTSSPFSETERTDLEETASEKQSKQKVEPTAIPKGIVSRIYQAVEAGKFQGALPITIREGWRNTVFKAVLGREPEINNITPKQLALIQKAIEDPQGLKGSIRIFVGKEKVFHVDSNKGIVFDKLALISDRARDRAVEKFSKNTQSTKSQKQADLKTQQAQATPTEEIGLKDQIERLQALVEQQQKQIESLTSRLDKFTNSPIFSALVNASSVSDWANQIHAKIKESGQAAVKQASQELNRNKKTLGNKIQEFFRNFRDRTTRQVGVVRERVSTRIEVTQSNVKQQVGDTALKVMGAAVRTVVNNVGEKSTDGSMTFQSPTNNRSYQVTGDRVTVSERAAIEPQSMWDKYSQGVEAKVPSELTLATAQNAIRAGEPRQNVLQMLSVDPEQERIQNERGVTAAKQYGELAFARASRSLQAAERQQSQQQPTRQVQTEKEV